MEYLHGCFSRLYILCFFLFNERKKFKENDSKEIFFNIINKEKENGLSEEIHDKAKKFF